MKKNKYAVLLSEEEGISYSEAYNEMLSVRSGTGLSFADFYRQGLHRLDSCVRFREAEKLYEKKEQRKQYIQEICDANRTSPEEVRAEIKRINNQLEGSIRITVVLYHDYEMYLMNEEEIEQTAALLSSRRSLSDRFKNIYYGGEPFENNLPELDSIFNEIKEINSILITETIISRYYEVFAERYPEMHTDETLRRLIVLDFLTLRNASGHSKTDYKLYDLYGKTLPEKLSFASDHEMTRIVSSLNSESARSFLDDKYNCYQKFRKYFRRSLVFVKSSENVDEFNRFCSKHSEFVKKPVYSRQGKGIRKVRTSDYRSVQEMAAELLSEDGEFIAEELVKGHPITSEFNKESLNTIRIVTINIGEKLSLADEAEEAVQKGAVRYVGRGIYCFTPFFKTGRKGTFVDNAGSGGVFAAINLLDGSCSELASSENGTDYTAHPDTLLRFDSLKFDNFNKALAMVKKMALKIPEAKIVGWDLALSGKNKWVLIEANYSPTFIGQAPARCGVHNALNAIVKGTAINR